MGKYAAIILAGGRGSRMGSEVPKQFLPLLGKPLLWYSLRAFEESEAEEIILVAPRGQTDACREEYLLRGGFQKITCVAEGGAERYDSVYAGLRALEERGCAYVAIHDGARPLVTPELISRVYRAAEKYGAAVAAVPVKDSVKTGDAEGYAAAAIPRENLWAMQTPQTFCFPQCLEAYRKMLGAEGGAAGVTDDAMAVERFAGLKVRLCMGDYQNLKVTTPEDLIAAEAYLRQRLK